MSPTIHITNLKIYPSSVYHGVDYIKSDINFYKDDSFILANLESDDALRDLSPIYDMIIINHVLEHITSCKKVFAGLLDLLVPGGVLYAEFPAIRTAQERKKIFISFPRRCNL